MRRFLAVLYPPFEYEQTTLHAEACGEHFTAKGKVVTSSGWKEVYENQLHEDDEDEIAESALKDQTLPCLSKGETYPIQNVSVTSGKTKPLRRSMKPLCFPQWKTR